MVMVMIVVCSSSVTSSVGKDSNEHSFETHTAMHLRFHSIHRPHCQCLHCSSCQTRVPFLIILGGNLVARLQHRELQDIVSDFQYRMNHSRQHYPLASLSMSLLHHQMTLTLILEHQHHETHLKRRKLLPYGYSHISIGIPSTMSFEVL